MTTSSLSKHTWVLLKGVAAHEGHWGHFLDHLRATFPNDRIELLTLAGNGPRSGEVSPISVKENVLDLRRILFSRLANGAKFHFLGTSMGAIVGVEWAKMFPNDFLSLTGVNTSDGAASPFYYRMQFYNLNQMVGLATYSAETKTSTPNVLRQIWASHWHRFPKKRPAVPMMFMASAEDKFAHPDCTLRICAKWNLEPAIHPRASHDLPIDDPQWVVGKLRAFRASLFPEQSLEFVEAETESAELEQLTML